MPDVSFPWCTATVGDQAAEETSVPTAPLLPGLPWLRGQGQAQASVEFLGPSGFIQLAIENLKLEGK